MLLIGVSALVMYTFRAAFVGNQLWAKIGSLLIATAVGCFVVYAALFLVANVFATATAPLRRVREASQAVKQASGDEALSAGEARR